MHHASDGVLRPKQELLGLLVPHFDGDRLAGLCICKPDPQLDACAEERLRRATQSVHGQRRQRRLPPFYGAASGKEIPAMRLCWLTVLAVGIAGAREFHEFKTCGLEDHVSIGAASSTSWSC